MPRAVPLELFEYSSGLDRLRTALFEAVPSLRRRPVGPRPVRRHRRGRKSLKPSLNLYSESEEMRTTADVWRPLKAWGHPA